MLRILTLILFFGSANSFAAKLFYAKGEVTINGKKVKKGANLPEGTTLSTGRKSLAIISFATGSKTKVEANTSVTIKKEEPQSKKITLYLKAGALFNSVTKQKTKKSHFKVFTRSVAMGVRGTDFFVTYSQRDEDSPKDLWMCVNEGAVLVQSLKDKKTELVKEGEGVLIAGGKEVTPPKKYQWTKKLNWNMDPKKDLENKADLSKAYYNVLDMDYD